MAQRLSERPDVREAGVKDDVRDDAELARAAADGDRLAFDDLYRRHAGAAWRVAYAVTGNRDDAADAVADAFTRMLTALTAGRLVDLDRVRPYLLATTRNAAVDVLRRNGRLQPLDELPNEQTGSLSAGPYDRLLDGVDASFVSQAFLSLPERWRSVLWLTEVEGMAPAEAATLLGVSANNAAQLAVRARAGLRQRFLQAHIRDDAAGTAGECAYTRERLGAYVGGGLAPRDIAKVDQHLAGCADCRAQLEELEDLGTTLRRVAAPLPLALGALAWKHFRDAATDTAARKGLAGLGGLGTQRAVTGASVGLLGLGIIALGILGPAGAGVAGGAPHALSGPNVGSRPIILAEDAAAAHPTATPLPLAGPGLPKVAATTVSQPAGASRPAAATKPAGTTTQPSPKPSTPSGSSPSPVPTLPLPSVTTSTGPTVQLSTTLNLAPAPVTATAGAGEGNGSATGVTVTTPVTTQTVGSPPPSSGSGSSSSSTPSASVSVTTPVTGSTSVGTPAAGSTPVTLP